ncbi:MAG: TatD family nuclease-associated radical SAM protein [Firmicutes bacterium]|nr:TatD family nuclease-associated radical SAM protein [Bacillota bacterium]
MKKSNTFVYEFEGNIYINLTNRCPNDCVFCLRRTSDGVGGAVLWLEREPEAKEVIEQLGVRSEELGIKDGSVVADELVGADGNPPERKDYSRIAGGISTAPTGSNISNQSTVPHSSFLTPHFNEVIFCGFGEPTYRIDALIAVAGYAHSIGLKTRLNTNGLANAIHGFDIVPKLKGVIDTVSISLNESSPERYDAVCRPEFGLCAYGHILDFAEKCVAAGIRTVLSVVDVIPPEEIEKCRETAVRIGAEFRVRENL